MSDSADGQTRAVYGTPAQMTAWIVLNVVPGHSIIPAILATILFSSAVRRHPVFVSFLFVWVVAAISSGILVYAGHTSGPEPPTGVCLFQASLLYGYPPMTSLAAFTIVLQAFLAIRDAVQRGPAKDRLPPKSWIRDWALISAPYASLIICAIATAIVGSQDSSKVSRNRRFFYCTVENDALTNFLAIFAAAVLLATVVLEIWSIIILYPRWAMLRTESLLDLNMILRVMAFAFYLIMCLSLSVLSVFHPTSPFPDLAIATAPSVVIVIFGTSRDILNVWCFWRKADSGKASSSGNGSEDFSDKLPNKRAAEEKGLPPLPASRARSSTMKLGKVLDVVETQA